MSHLQSCAFRSRLYFAQKILFFFFSETLLKKQLLTLPVSRYKSSFLLPDEEGGNQSKEGLLISETVVPGFEYCDHDFLAPETLVELVGKEKAGELSWLLSPLGKK
jgi:predicted cupin superfamily sugar epimerase